MKREIKFRAFQDNEMLVQPMSGNYAAARFFGLLYEDAPVMQFTGLRDKNGKEIYEGDLITVSYPEKGKGRVVWQEKDCRFGVLWLNDTEMNSALSVRAGICEVTGTIYDK